MWLQVKKNHILFSDINECSILEDNCDANAACVNTIGSFTCTCKPGFTGNGVACAEIGEFSFIIKTHFLYSKYKQ